MNEKALYINPKGQPVTHSSYSSRQTFKHCPREFELTRVQGWWDKEHRAAPLFGKCVEAGVQAFEQNNRQPGYAVEVFERLWNDVKTVPEYPQLIFTDKEKDWDGLLRAGREMMRLYEIRAPFLPISRNPPALWQQVIRKKIFPGSHLDKLENKAIMDILSFPKWDHPLLPKIAEPPLPYDIEAFHEPRSLIIDMKTSGVDLDTRLVILDPQLAEYAWMARIPDVAFLWFVKHGHELRKGSRVTLLETPKDSACYAGFELLVVALGEHNDVFLGDAPALQAYNDALKGIRGKARDALEAAHLVSGVVSGKLIHVQESAVTKQRLQFAAARFTEEDMNDIGRDVAQTTVEMVRANDEQYYPKLAGIRFPNAKCPFCAMRWICLNLPEERDKNLSRKGEEWLDGKEEE